MTDTFELATLSVRAGGRRTEFQEHSEALFLTSSFVFDNAAQAAARFTGGEEGFVYSRFTNPTVSMFQDRLAALEGAQACVATASGMSAILAMAMALLKAGDHVVCSSAVFGSTVQLFSGVLARFGLQTTFVSPTDVREWEKALRPNTKLLFLETPSNPLTEISDIGAISAVAKKAGALLAVDNWFCTPALLASSENRSSTPRAFARRTTATPIVCGPAGTFRRTPPRASRPSNCTRSPFSVISIESSVPTAGKPKSPPPARPTRNSYSASSGKICRTTMPPRVPSGSPSRCSACDIPRGARYVVMPALIVGSPTARRLILAAAVT